MASASGAALADAAGAMEALGFDSIWLADVMSVPADDPMVALSYLAGRLGKLKLGTTAVLPGRNPVRFAREVATLDRLSGGRLLLTLVVGIRRRRELEAMGSPAEAREAQMDEMLPLLRRLWEEDAVDHDGPQWQLRGARVDPRPLQQPLDVWVGGTSPAALQRAGRLSDGWLPSMCTPQEAAAGRAVIEQAAADAGRRIDPEHFGVSVGYLTGQAPEEIWRRLAARRPGVDPATLVPADRGALRDLLERFVAVGFSKFVVRPVLAPTSWPEELEALATAVLDLQR